MHRKEDTSTTELSSRSALEPEPIPQPEPNIASDSSRNTPDDARGQYSLFLPSSKRRLRTSTADLKTTKNLQPAWGHDLASGECQVPRPSSLLRLSLLYHERLRTATTMTRIRAGHNWSYYYGYHGYHGHHSYKSNMDQDPQHIHQGDSQSVRTSECICKPDVHQGPRALRVKWRKHKRQSPAICYEIQYQCAIPKARTFGHRSSSTRRNEMVLG